MSSLMIANSYGKADIKLVKVLETTPAHTMRYITTRVMLKGDFASSYLVGDNTMLIPTDTIKNIVYLLAAEDDIDSLEGFAQRVGQHFLKQYEHVLFVDLILVEDRYDHVETGIQRNPHPTSFVSQGGEKRGTEVKCHRNGTIEIASRIFDLSLVRTSGSQFRGFHRDSYTTLKDAEQRIIATNVDITYIFYDNADCNFNSVYDRIRNGILYVFCNHKSLSMQQTVLAMAKEVIRVAEDVKETRVKMPNKHFLALEASNHIAQGSTIPPVRPHKPSVVPSNVFIPTESPYGIVRCVVRRHHVAIPAPFEWDLSFDIGHKEMNEQHKSLFDLIRELDKDRKNAALLKRILGHAVQHFKDEEAIFCAPGVVDAKKAENHKRIHQRFVKQAVEATDGKPVTDETILFLKRWLVEHIMGPDMQLGLGKKPNTNSKL